MNDQNLKDLFYKEVKRERISGLYIKHEKLQNFSLLDTTIENCHFKNVSFCDSRLTNCDFYNCVFEDCLLKDTSFMYSEISYSIFEDCDFKSALVSESRLHYNNFKNCNFGLALFPNTLLSDQTFRACTPNWNSKELLLAMLEEHITWATVSVQTIAWIQWAASKYSGCWSNILAHLPEDALREGIELLYKLYKNDPRKVKPANYRMRNMFEAYDQGEEGWKL